MAYYNLVLMCMCVSKSLSVNIYCILCGGGPGSKGTTIDNIRSPVYIYTVQQFYNSHKATNYELLVSRRGETMESILLLFRILLYLNKLNKQFKAI